MEGRSTATTSNFLSNSPVELPDKFHILLIEDSTEDARRIRQEIEKGIFAGKVILVHVESISAGLRALRANRFDLILLDLSLPDGFGLENLEKIRKTSASVPILILTGLDDLSTALECLRGGASDVLFKTQSEDSIVQWRCWLTWWKKNAKLTQQIDPKTHLLPHSFLLKAVEAEIQSSLRRRRGFGLIALLTHDLNEVQRDSLIQLCQNYLRKSDPLFEGNRKTLYALLSPFSSRTDFYKISDSLSKAFHELPEFPRLKLGAIWYTAAENLSPKDLLKRAREVAEAASDSSAPDDSDTKISWTYYPLIDPEDSRLLGYRMKGDEELSDRLSPFKTLERKMDELNKYFSDFDRLAISDTFFVSLTLPADCLHSARMQSYFLKIIQCQQKLFSILAWEVPEEKTVHMSESLRFFFQKIQSLGMKIILTDIEIPQLSIFELRALKPVAALFSLTYDSSSEEAPIYQSSLRLFKNCEIPLIGVGKPSKNCSIQQMPGRVKIFLPERVVNLSHDFS